MTYSEAKEEFIQAWGALGTAWGVNKTMAQIFALLVITPHKLTVEEIMDELGISRGNTSMNLRSLMDWELVSKTTVKGERKEYFYCDRDIWSLSQRVADQRRKREVGPTLRVLEKVNAIDDVNSEEAKEFKRVTGELKLVVEQVDTVLNQFVKSKSNSVLTKILTFFKSKD